MMLYDQTEIIMKLSHYDQQWKLPFGFELDSVAPEVVLVH